MFSLNLANILISLFPYVFHGRSIFRLIYVIIMMQ